MTRSIRRPQRGISLVESLVALVVLSVGMLGIASLYITSLKANRQALVRTQAVNLATDLADRIRANRLGKSAYNLAGTSTLPSKQGCVGGDKNCTPGQLAQDDLARWIESLGNTMPMGTRGEVTYTPRASSDEPDVYTITVRWREPGDTADSTAVMVVEV